MLGCGFVLFLLPGFVEKEEGGAFGQVGQMAFPLGESACAHFFAGAGELGGDAQAGLGTAGGDYLLQKPVVAERGFYEELGLVLGIGPGFELAQGAGTLGGVDGEITVESETLPVESGSHQAEQDGRRPHKGDDAQPLLLGEGYDVGSRVGHGGATGFGEQAHGLPLFGKGAEVGGQDFGVLFAGVLVEGIESEGVDVNGRVGFLQKAAG